MPRPTTMFAAATMALAVGGTAAADLISQTVDFAWDGTTPPPTLTFESFDDAGGTRELTGIDVTFQGDLAAEFVFANYGADAAPSGTWFAEASYSLVMSVGGIGGPLVGLGGVSAIDITGDLGAGTGSPFGPPGDPVLPVLIDGTVDLTRAIDASSFDAFTGGGTFDASLTSFTDVVLTTPPPGGGPIFATVASESQSGSITVDYSFTVVPGPGAAGLLALAGLAGARRRRTA